LVIFIIAGKDLQTLRKTFPTVNKELIIPTNEQARFQPDYCDNTVLISSRKLGKVRSVCTIQRTLPKRLSPLIL